MAFVVPKETYNGKVYEVEVGTGPKAVKVGGESTLPFLAFEGAVPNKPVIAYEIQDCPPEDWPQTLQDVYKDVSGDPVKWAKHCQNDLGAQMIALRLISTHPDRQNTSPEDAAKTVKAVLAAVDVPLAASWAATMAKRTPRCSRPRARPRRAGTASSARRRRRTTRR